MHCIVSHSASLVLFWHYQAVDLTNQAHMLHQMVSKTRIIIENVIVWPKGDGVLIDVTTVLRSKRGQIY